MTKNYRQTVARIFLPFLAIWLCVMPSRAYAILPLIPLAAAFFEADAVATAGVAASVAIAEAATGTSAGVLAGAASLTVTDAVATGIVTLVGAVLTYLSIVDSNGNAVRVPLVADPLKGNIPAPTGAPATTSSSLQNVTTYMLCLTAGRANCTSSTDTITVFNNMKALGYVPADATVCSPIPTAYLATQQDILYGRPSGNVCGTNPITIYLFDSQNLAPSCPPGYMLSGSICNLINARAAVADKKLDFKRSGNVYSSPDVNDADAVTQSLKGAIGSSSNVQIVGTDNRGRTILYDVIPRSDGGSTVKVQTAVADSVGNTGTRTQTFNISSAAIVESASQSTTAQQLSVNTSTGTGSATATTVAGDVGAAAPATQLQPEQQTIVFPTDYARQGEAQSAADTLAPQLDSIKNSLSDSESVPNPSVLTSADMPGFDNTFSDLLSWRLPAHFSVCPQPVLDLSFMGLGTHVMNVQCQIMADHGAALRTSMLLVFSIAALFIVLRA